MNIFLTEAAAATGMSSSIIMLVAMLAIFIVKTRKYADSNASAVHHAHA